ncbi:MAG: hypothetical protein HQL54_01055 [Magnetococcales bacterium]|nr:hypothetical protein [Magnetococcales bacterium]
MNKQLAKLGKKMYGDSVADWVCIRLMARDLQIPEKTVDRWWRDKHLSIPPEAQSAIFHLMEKRGKFKEKTKVC